METDVIQLVLESNALNVEATVAALLAMNKPAEDSEIPTIKLPKLYKSRCEMKMDMKVAAEQQDFHKAAKRKDQLAAVETAIQADLAQGHKATENAVEIRLGEDGKAGFDFKYHAGGWDVTLIHDMPGQPDLKPGDRIIKVGSADVREISYEAQLGAWKKAAADTKKFPATIIRFVDASTTKEEKAAQPTASSKQSNRHAAEQCPPAELKRQPSDMKFVGETPEQERARIVEQLLSGQVPDDFLRTPSYFQQHGMKKAQSQMEKDAALARLLQDEMFMEELRNNPDAFLEGRPRRSGNQRRARTQAALVQTNSAPGSNPAGPAPQADLSGQGSAPKKTTWSERWSKLGDAAKERLAKMAEFFKNKKNDQKTTRSDDPAAELVPLAEEADRLPLAPDLAEEGGAFVIESDEEMGVGPGVCFRVPSIFFSLFQALMGWVPCRMLKG
uniref:PDZ domain-containing protein n=1 Tax=Lotharella globosa TaxID=91324 RepID=A0A7S3YKM5_9EUKA